MTSWEMILERYPSKIYLRGSSYQKHITLFDENSLRMRVDVETGQVMARETK